MRLRLRTLFGLLMGSLALLVVLLPDRTAADNLDGQRIIQERINWWKTDPRGKQYYQEIAPATGVATGSGKAHALCIGLNFVDPNFYEGWDGQLAGCINDADAMVKIANDMKFDTVKRMVDGEAKMDAVLGYLHQKAKELQAGDLLLVTYSGHGGQAPDSNEDESDKYDETWCLFDGQVIDDELGALWPEFKSGVRIVVISDSCHSGTVTKVLAPIANRQDKGESSLKKSKVPERDVLLKRAEFRTNNPFGVKDPKNNLPHAFRMMPEKVMNTINAAPKHLAYFKQVNDRFKRDKDAPLQIDATVLLISGCQDDQTSQDGTDNGLFTANLLAVWKNGSFSGNYRQLYEAIRANMQGGQQPNLFMFGKDQEGLSSQKPFQK
jgi:metacaspase-1